MQAKNLTVRNVFIGQYPNEDDTIKGKISGIIPQGIDGIMPL